MRLRKTPEKRTEMADPKFLYNTPRGSKKSRSKKARKKVTESSKKGKKAENTVKKGKNPNQPRDNTGKFVRSK